MTDPTPPGSDRDRPIRVLIGWSNISGYMAACWRALSERPDVDLHVAAFAPGGGTNTAFTTDLLHGIDAELFDRADEAAATATLRRLIDAFRPDVVVVAGWFYGPYRELAKQRQANNQTVVMTIDLPWRGTWRQYASLVVNRGYVRNMDAVMTAGERAVQYIQRFGGDPSRIRTGLYGFDADAFAEAAARRETTQGWPRRFLFVGRYVPAKSIDVLIAGYERYRALAEAEGRQPWALDACGLGPWDERLRAVPGVTDHGFVSPVDLPGRMAAAGVFVLPSQFEPWGVALAEGMGAGMPAICTTACGAAVDLVRPCFNGLTVAPGDADALAQAMLWMDHHRDELPDMGRRAREHAAAFGARFWAQRWSKMLAELAG